MFYFLLNKRVNETLKIQGQYLNDHFQYLKFGVVACKNKTFTDSDKWKYTCLSFSEQQSVLKSENIRFRMMYPNYIVNAGNPKDILTGFLDMLYFSIQPGAMYTTADIYFSNHYVETDQSLLPFEEIEDDKYIVFTLNNYRLQTLVGNYTSMAEFYIRSDFFSIQTTRTFTKVDEFISYIGGFAQVFLLASAYLVSVYNDLEYQVKLANKLYDFEFQNKKQKNNSKKKKEQDINIKSLSQKYMMNGNENNNPDKMQSDTQIMGLSQRFGVNSNQQINDQNDYLNGKSNQIGQNNDDLSRMSYDQKAQDRIKKLPSIKTDTSKFDKKRQQQQVTFQNHSISQSYQQPLIHEQSPTSEVGKKFFPSPKTKYEVGMNSMAESKGQLSMLDELQSPTDSFRCQLNQNLNFSKRNDDQSFTKNQQGIPFQSPVSNHNKSTNSPQHNQKQQSNQQEDLVTAIQNAKVNTNAKIIGKQQSQKDSNHDIHKSTFFSPRDKTQSSIPRILLQDKKQFLEHEIKEILKKAKKISVTFKYFLFKITCKKLFADDQNILIDKACDRVEEDLDILVLLNRLKDVEKIKEILFDNQQQLLFNFFPKPVIKVSGVEEEIPDKKSLKKDAKNEPKKKFKNDLKINLKQLGYVMKAVKKFKEPISRKIMSFDNVDAYQKLFQAYEYVSYKNPNSLQIYL